MKSSWKKMVVWYLVVAMLVLGITPRLYAGFSPSEAISLPTVDRSSDLDKIRRVLEMKMVRERIKDPDCQRGYVLDGFPRTVAQAKSLDRMDGRRKEIVIEIDIEVDTLIKRLLKRRICSRCGAIYNLELQPPRIEGQCDLCVGPVFERVDYRPDIIRERLRVYRDQTEKVKDFYLRRGVFKKVDGTGTVEEVFSQIKRLLDAELAQGEEAKTQR